MSNRSPSPLAALILVLATACGDSGGRESTTDVATTVTTPGTVADTTDAQPTGGTTTMSSPTGGSEAGTSTGTGAAPLTSSTTAPDETTTPDETGPVDPATTSTDPGTTTDEPPPECNMTLKAVVRDFSVGHPDFEDYLGDEKGIVLADLGPDLKPVYAAAGPTAVTSGPENFAQWYNDTPGINIPFMIDIQLTESMPGVYTYDNSEFFPIDGQGFGDEGNIHNYHFTTEIHTQFTYQGGEVFTFTGDDDLWLFINHKLAIDLGGVHGAETQAVDLDASAGALGIQKGIMYPMDIFHAERHTSQSNFRVDTTIACFVIPG